MDKCKACGRDFASTNPNNEICYPCQNALKRLNGYVVPVVRCKDCMWARPKDHREPTEVPRDFICQCAKHHYIPAPWGARMAVNAEDFCSYGERKDNEKL